MMKKVFYNNHFEEKERKEIRHKIPLSETERLDNIGACHAFLVSMSWVVRLSFRFKYSSFISTFSPLSL